MMTIAGPQDLHPKASRKNLRMFELVCVMLWAVTAVLIATVYDNQRDYWFLLLSWTFMFPFSAIADEYALVLRYDTGFLNLVWRVPAMVPFAFGWFFTLPLVLIWNTQVIEQFAPHAQILILFTVLVAWSFCTEWLGVKQNLWTYHWSPPGRRWKGVPVVIPFIDAITYVLIFVLHEEATRMTANMSWIGAFAISYLIYAGAFAVFASISWLVIRRFLGVRPTLM
uniref:Uncharacterized protein n=1 Tax=Caulobacter sp. (strain K31) TaxID=366602 RepID=B0T7D8_CAUSK